MGEQLGRLRRATASISNILWIRILIVEQTAVILSLPQRDARPLGKVIPAYMEQTS